MKNASFFSETHTFLPPIKIDDILCVKNTGTYGHSISSNYNRRLCLAEALLASRDAKLISKLDSFENQVENYLIE